MSAVAPLTDKSSSTVVVPPAESIVRLPEVVSISLPSILTLSTVALPLTSRTPSTVASSRVVLPSTSIVPVTAKLSSTVVVPPAESIVRFPDAVSISLSSVTPI